MISIHVPAWGTTPANVISIWLVGFQSTFPRGERLSNVSEYLSNVTISIHVPAWGTTHKRYIVYVDDLEISIHVPAWGTTKTSAFARQLILISIHVPAWGTTC